VSIPLPNPRLAASKMEFIPEQTRHAQLERLYNSKMRRERPFCRITANSLPPFNLFWEPTHGKYPIFAMIGLVLYQHLYSSWPSFALGCPLWHGLKSVGERMGALLLGVPKLGHGIAIGRDRLVPRMIYGGRTMLFIPPLPRRSSALRWGPILGFLPAVVRWLGGSGLSSRFVRSESSSIPSLIFALGRIVVMPNHGCRILIILMGLLDSTRVYRPGARCGRGHHRDGLCEAARLRARKIGLIIFRKPCRMPYRR